MWKLCSHFGTNFNGVFRELALEKVTVCLIKWILFVLVGEQASKKLYRVCVTV